MSERLLRSTAFRARAILLGVRLDLRNWPKAETLARAPLTTRLSGGGIAVLFRNGVAVLLDATASAEEELRERLASLTEHRYGSPEAEELDVRIDEARLEGLNALLEDEFEIRERLDIVGLIVFEILLSVYGMWRT